MEEGDGGASTSPPTATATPAKHTPAMPVREDCWSEEATHTLVEAWGERYLELNRGNLRQKHWQEVADAVNVRHGHVKKARRTDVQCKNRIDTLKKKYKIEKARVSELAGTYTSQWPFFSRLDSLIGSSYKPSPTLAPAPRAHRKTPPPALPPPPSSVPVGPRSKRPAAALSPALLDNSFLRRNFSAMAAAAAAAAEAEEESDTSRSRSSAGSRRREGHGDGTDGYRRLAEALERFADIYERVEEAKQRQMVELEKQRMQFAKDLEIQRMKLFMDSQIQLQKIKRAKRTSEAESYL
ncbi:trihelix transcription factor ASIL2-like isoform X2 [Diospyros lotus]|uniref:trihelix transcription factor ASIL2-like isoform X2 n=1 Tax=Diospyros lotus TaxID=55363 RepID=UPI00225516F7|nr:trihelix transcription factor ASIL2-like isoform X2 [Diospyros lotus]